MTETVKYRWFDAGLAALAVGGVAALLTRDAAADGRFAAPKHAAYAAECGACHVAYPPALLPARSWNALMTSLDRHFGVDASLSPDGARDIGAFLAANAAPERAVAAGSAVPTRITALPWFQREHLHVATRTGGDKPFADCADCHRDAATGDFRERGLLVRHEGRTR